VNPPRADGAGRALRGDDGSTLPLVIFYGMLGLVVVLLVAAASSLYLERKRLFTLADGAALVGAEAFELDDVEVVGGELRPRLESDEVDAAVADYLTGNPVGEFEALTVEAVTDDDGLSATVTVTSSWRPPVVSALLPSGLRVTATSTARAVFD
jgi:hypothetical protein